MGAFFSRQGHNKLLERSDKIAKMPGGSHQTLFDFTNICRKIDDLGEFPDPAPRALEIMRQRKNNAETAKK